jgi:hypothetical protein
MNTPLDDVCCASLPLAALPALAAVRCVPDVSVAMVGERAWVRWPPGRAEVLVCVAALVGVELYEPRDGQWYRPGQHLPAFGLPIPAPSRPLAQVLVPAPVQPELVPDLTLPSVKLRLVRNVRPRPATALWGSLSALRKWADRAPTAELVAVCAARCDGRVLLLGRRLPPLPGAERLWGERVLIPLGYQPEPALPESALLEALQGTADELVVLTTDGAEMLPRSALQPLTRSGMRLALGGGR